MAIRTKRRYRLLFKYMIASALVNAAPVFAAQTFPPPTRYNPADLYAVPGTRIKWSQLKPVNRYRVLVNKADTPVENFPGSGIVCKDLPANVSGTVINDGAGDDNGYYLVKWDYWPKSCENIGMKNGWGFIKKSSAHPLDNRAVDQILNDLAEKDEALHSESDLNPPECAPENSQFDSVGQLLGHIINTTAGLKDDKQLERYLQCYKTPYQDKYEKEYKKLIGAAHDAFGVPKVLLTCLLRRESRFDKDAKSPTGAIGLGQQTTDNQKFISRLVGDSAARHQKKQTAKGTTGRQWDKYMNEVRAKWPSLLKDCSGNFTLNDRTCPAASIAAASIYLVQIQKELRQSARVHFVKWENYKSSFLTAAAAYNVGNGFASNAVQGLTNTHGWIEALMGRPLNKAKHDELSNHVQALRNCMSAGNWNPPSERDPKKSCK